MTDHTQRSALEAKTHELFSEESYKARNITWTPYLATVAMVFRAMWHASLSVQEITRIGKALGSYNEHDAIDFSPVLTKLTRAGILRSATRRGQRHYEVNY